MLVCFWVVVVSAALSAVVLCVCRVLLFGVARFRYGFRVLCVCVFVFCCCCAVLYCRVCTLLCCLCTSACCFLLLFVLLRVVLCAVAVCCLMLLWFVIALCA